MPDSHVITAIAGLLAGVGRLLEGIARLIRALRRRRNKEAALSVPIDGV